MYYITKKDSETGKKFQEIAKKRDIAHNEASALAEKYNIKQWRGAYWQVFGGMSSCIFEEKPDTKLWGKGAVDGEYFPKQNSKAGKAIYKEIDDLTCVERHELNACIGFEGGLSTIGFSDRNKEYFGFEFDEEWKLEMPKDCEEVLTTRYNELFKD